MEEPMAIVFEVEQSGQFSAIIFAGLFLLIGLGGMWFGIKKQWKNDRNKAYRPIVALLSFIVVLLAAGTLIFGLLAGQKLEPVILYETHIKTNYGDIPYKQIRNAYLEADETQYFRDLSRRDTTFLLIIENQQGQASVLSSVNYDVRNILKTMRELIEKQRSE